MGPEAEVWESSVALLYLYQFIWYFFVSHILSCELTSLLYFVFQMPEVAMILVNKVFGK